MPTRQFNTRFNQFEHWLVDTRTDRSHFLFVFFPGYMIVTALNILAWVAAVLIAGGVADRLHHWLVSLEDRGYIYYRKKPRGGGGGVFFEMDKLTRPSVEHVQKAMDTEAESQENDGE